MKILIVEDDDYKRNAVTNLLTQILKKITISNSSSVYEAIQYLIQENFDTDLILLDMSLPSHPAMPGQGTPISLPTGGLEIIYELVDNNLLDIPIIILTQYPDIMINNIAYPIHECTDILKKEFKISELLVTYYDDSSNESEWKKSIEYFIERNIINENSTD